jgi:hypothetical protein
LVEATKIGDTARIAQLTSKNFGRTSDTGPLGLYRLVARERGLQGDLFDDIEFYNQRSRTEVDTVEKTTQFKSQYKSLSAEKKNVYNKFRQRKFRIIKDFQESLRKTKLEFNTKQVAYLKIDEQLAGLEEVAFDRFQSIVNGGGSIETLKSFVETYRYKFMNTDIDVVDVDYVLEQIDTLSSFFTGSELRRNLKNMFAEQFTRTRSQILLARDIEIQSILQEMVYMSRTIEESYGLLRILPDNYFASPLGTTDATDVLLKNQNVTRSVVPDAVPTSKEFEEVQAVYDALKSNDVYPVHKSVENYANILYILAIIEFFLILHRQCLHRLILNYYCCLL